MTNDGIGTLADSDSLPNRVKGKIHVALLDDDTEFRRNLRRMLELDDDIRVVVEAGSADEAMNTLMASAPDVVLMDIRFGRVSGLDAIRLLRAKGFAGALVVSRCTMTA